MTRWYWYGICKMSTGYFIYYTFLKISWYYYHSILCYPLRHIKYLDIKILRKFSFNQILFSFFVNYQWFIFEIFIFRFIYCNWEKSLVTMVRKQLRRQFCGFKLPPKAPPTKHLNFSTFLLILLLYAHCLANSEIIWAIEVATARVYKNTKGLY